MIVIPAQAGIFSYILANVGVFTNNFRHRWYHHQPSITLHKYMYPKNHS